MIDSRTANFDEERAESTPAGAVGLDPISGADFAEIIAPHEPETAFYGRSPTPIERRSELTPMTWVMIVVAGVVLGFAVAMLLAGA